jgi:signal transduction histidine kinase
VFQERIELLRKAFPELPEPLLGELAQKVQERAYPIGTILCKEGAVEDVFYIIGSGRVVVSKFLDGETSRILTYQGPGEFFGELALIHDTQRAATVVTLEETTVFELSKKEFLAFLESSPTMVVTIMRAVASRLRDADQRSIADLRRKNKELSQAYRELEAETQQRSEFLTTVAHELRTPLTTVKGYLHSIESGTLPGQTVDDAIEAVSDNADAIIRLINSILFLQELELIEPQFHPVAAGELVQQAVQEIRPVAGRLGLEIHLDAAPDVAPIMGDSGSLKQALMMLMENAIRFSPGGSAIQVQVSPQGQVLEISVRAPEMDISQGDIERLFDRVQHRDVADPRLSGSVRLGLPIAKAVVEQHNGSIQVTSGPGRGCTFIVRLPVSSE